MRPFLNLEENVSISRFCMKCSCRKHPQVMSKFFKEYAFFFVLNNGGNGRRMMSLIEGVQSRKTWQSFSRSFRATGLPRYHVRSSSRRLRSNISPLHRSVVPAVRDKLRRQVTFLPVAIVEKKENKSFAGFCAIQISE